MRGNHPPPLLQVRDLRVEFMGPRRFPGGDTPRVTAVDGVSFRIRESESFALVGESGSGKTTLARAILQLVKPTAGDVIFRGTPLGSLDREGLRATRRRIQMIFQDPRGALNPRIQVGRAVREPLDIHALGSDGDRDDRVGDLLERVGLGPSVAQRYPHELSGGQVQRIVVARALATNPDLLIADEPFSSLDASIRSQMVNLLEDLREDLGLNVLLIAHDLALVRHLTNRVAVMYAGSIVEEGVTEELFEKPLHPYTKTLIAAIPRPDPGSYAAPAETEASHGTQGEVQTERTGGCPFLPRCPRASDVCRRETPALRGLPGAPSLRRVSCHHAG